MSNQLVLPSGHRADRVNCRLMDGVFMLDIVYVLGVIAVFALIGVVAWGAEKL